MRDNIDSSVPNHEESANNTAAEYLRRAQAACAEGDEMLGMHLYLAAYEEGVSAGGGELCVESLQGLKEAWTLACALRERSLAEYIFEKMEPYLDADEVADCAAELQELALDKLEEFGLSREELESMAQMISHDLLGTDFPVVKIEQIFEQSSLLAGRAQGESEDSSEDSDAPVADEGAPSDAPNGPADDAPAREEGHKARPDAPAAPARSRSHGAAAPAQAPARLSQTMARESPMEALARSIGESANKHAERVERLSYSTVAGYETAIRVMRDLGIGMQGDEDFNNLVQMLNARHGLDSMPAIDTLLFSSPAREDANRFIAATLGELRLPVLRMHMEENVQGMPILCVTAQAESAAKLNSMQAIFNDGGVLVLEDIDIWGSPLAEMGDDVGDFLMMQLSRGEREAINLDRSAVDNPDVYVFATTSSGADLDDFFLDLLEPVSLVDIGYPTYEERCDIWMDIKREHPSLRSLDREDLVRLSANMPRYDIYMAALEAVEQAYKAGLASRRYRQVTRDNIYDKLAAYQPLDSREYRELEETVIRDFRMDLDHIDDLLAGE